MMIGHMVYFTLHDHSSEAIQALVDSCSEYLSGHPGTVFFSAGTRVSDLNREVNDQEFHVALHVVFDSRHAHDQYQEHERHLTLLGDVDHPVRLAVVLAALGPGEDRVVVGHDDAARGGLVEEVAVDGPDPGHHAVGRALHIVDTNIIGNLLNGVAFYSSTTILAVGGLLAVLGAPDSAIQILKDLPFAVETTRAMWELKVLVLVGILIITFFKFAWAYRLFNNCSVLIGAAPIEAAGDPQAEALAERAGKLNSLAARHFNRALRAYFFALATLSWFINPLIFVITVTLVVCVIFRRDFRSRSLMIVRQDS